MSTLKVNNITDLGNNYPGLLTYPGQILQVVQSVKTDSFASSTGALWTDVTGLSVSITPSSTSSKILVMLDLKGSGQASASILRSRIIRNGTPIYVGDSASLRPQSLGQAYYLTNANYMAQIGGSFVDSPNTVSELTYSAQIGADSTSLTVYINRTQGDRDAAVYDARGASSIIVMEIAG